VNKTIQIAGIERPITLTRRKGSRSIRISIKSDGSIRVNVPYGVPEFVARKFVSNKAEWIKQHSRQEVQIGHGMRIGKNHQLQIVQGNNSRSRTVVSDTEILIVLRSGSDIQSEESQKTIKSACEKALKQQAERLLPQRVQYLSDKFGIPYNSCKIQKLKSRWGACDRLNNLSFNSYLMQLDWILIDYVICHELAHTIHHHHQESFWHFVEKLYPKYRTARKILKTKRTEVTVGDF
jgi:predicted metal-dependent hydrolase